MVFALDSYDVFPEAASFPVLNAIDLSLSSLKRINTLCCLLLIDIGARLSVP